ncbi:MAG TPA: RNA methyltransferase [Pyrinomonadaceae bacterium]|nr:RNA methyltransferase [Pyrinomonadaceae bacterium]
MTDKMITSRSNNLIKYARAVRDGKHRGLMFLEGLRLCEEARDSLSVDDIQDVIYTERISNDERGSYLLDSLRETGKPLTLVSESVFSSISNMKSPEGIVILAARPVTRHSSSLKISDEIPLIVIMHRINNPSNAGAILRTAEAMGVSGVIVTEGTTDIFAPRALRGAMGSSLRLKIWTGARFFQAIAFCRRQSIRVACAELHARSSHTEIDWTVPKALLVGSEATGLTPDEIAAADESLTIPMRPPVESLNVAVATGIILFEAARQRAVGSRQ